MTDIVKRLLDPDDMDEYHDVRRDAAIEIERLAMDRNAHLQRAERAQAETERLQSTLVTRRDMDDARHLGQQFGWTDIEGWDELVHDIAQAIANGRRAVEPKP